jgi:acyl carrier protein
VVHAAGLLDDATLLNLSSSRIPPVLAPKVRGAVFLDRLLPDLDLFVSFSSVASVLGSAGQASYAAANAFLDAFAHHRVRRDAAHSLSLDWGVWADVGLATRSDRVSNVARQGLALLSPDQGADLFERLLASSLHQLVPAPLDVRQWRQANPQAAAMPLLSELAATRSLRSETSSPIAARLRAASSDRERGAILEELVRSAIAQLLHLPPGELPKARALKDLGFDSLMTVSLKNTLERELAIFLSTASVYAHPTVERLTRFLLSSAAPSASSVAEPPSPSDVVVEPPPSPAEDVDALSDDEVSAELARRFLKLRTPIGEHDG